MNPFASLNAWLIEILGPLGPLLAVGMLGVLLILIALPTVLKRRRDRFRELRDLQPGPGDDKKRALRRAEKVDKLERFAQFLEPQKKEELSASKLKMLRAGYTSKNAVRMFHAAQFMLALSFLAVGGLVTLIMSINGSVFTSNQVLMFTLLPCAVGYFIPRYWVDKRLQQRQAEIIQGFPDALDMMLVCVEAGQSLDQSIIRVGKESRLGYPALADEFDMVAQEVKAGKERTMVLKDMAERVGVPDVASFVTTLVQSATFGTSVAEALRVYSADMRDKRIMRAEEKANMLPTKLTLGTMLFTVPPLLVILIGPSLHGIATTLGGLTSG